MIVGLYYDHFIMIGTTERRYVSLERKQCHCNAYIYPLNAYAYHWNANNATVTHTYTH